MTTWVLLRGLMRESRHWGEFHDIFRDSVAAARIVTLDFPGNGRLHDRNSLTSVAAMADYCHTALGRAGHAPPYRVLALSLGAMVAVAWNRQYPDDLEKMVLINTSLAPYSPFYRRLRPENYASLVRLLLSGTARQRERTILRLTSAKDRQSILDQWVCYAQEYPIARANILRQLYAAMHYRAAEPRIPVLLLAGARDRLVDVRCSLVLSERWHCPIRIHPEAGHDLPLDDPVWVAQQVKAWS